MKRTLLFFADYWDNMWRRRQQLAWRLAQAGWVAQVIYIERPLPVTSFIKFLVGRADRDGMDRWRRVMHKHSWLMPVADRFSVLTTFAPFPPVATDFLFRASERMRDGWLLHYLRSHFQLNDPLVWVSHPQLSVKVIQAFRPCLLWYDCTEDFSAFPGFPDCVRAQIKATDLWLTEHADVVTAVSRTLYEEKRKVNPNLHWLPNAVDTDLFLQPQETYPIPPELHNRPRPILAFVGGLSEWAHDWELLDEVAALRPNWTILLIGPTSVSAKTQGMLAGHSNILCVGQKHYQELPAYLAHSDICFQFYRVARGNDTRNSQKLFLYFAAGKPVVSTPSTDLEEYSSLVEVVETAHAFVSCVEQVAADRSPKMFRSRQEMARANSWQARIEQIRQILAYTDARKIRYWLER